MSAKNTLQFIDHADRSWIWRAAGDVRRATRWYCHREIDARTGCAGRRRAGAGRSRFRTIGSSATASGCCPARSSAPRCAFSIARITSWDRWRSSCPRISRWAGARCPIQHGAGRHRDQPGQPLLLLAHRDLADRAPRHRDPLRQLARDPGERRGARACSPGCEPAAWWSCADRLVDIEGREGGMRTSLRRDDTGAGACEILLATSARLMDPDR